MSLPASFLLHVEQHACFTGCYSSASGVRVCLDPNAPLAPLVVVSCGDCYASLAVPASLLPAGTDSYRLADQVTQHLRKQRGFALSVSGYQTKGPGFWFSAVYYSCGIFLIHGERSRKLGTDLDQLMLAFHHGVWTPPDSRMIDPKQYAVQTVYANFTGATGPVRNKQDVLALPQVRSQPQSGWQKLTLAEFLPLTTAGQGNGHAVAPTAQATRKPAAPRVLKPGDVCPVCGAEVRERPLLRGSFVGCLC
jgi:hypothetical protein